MQRILNTLAVTIAVIGAINWGLVGLLRFNLVSRLLGRYFWAERLVYGLVGIAGLWLGLMLAWPRLLVALGMRPRAVKMMRSIVGSALPSLGGTTLGGKRIALPDDVRGKVVFLVMGFAYEARFDVEDWTRAFKERFGEEPDVIFFEMPIIGGVYRLFAPMIDAGMRRGTPPEMYDHVVTVYAPREPIREALGAAPYSDTWVYLLDRDGKVLFQYGGPFDPQRFEEVAALTEVALGKARPRARRAA